MTTKLKSSVTLQRSDDRGESVDTTVEYIQGMPSVVRVTQSQNGKTSQVSLTVSESKYFRYVLGEFENFSHFTKQIDNDEDDDDSDRSLRIGGGFGVGLRRA